MVNCCRYAGKPFQILFVRQHGDRFRAEKVGVPDRQQAQQHRQVFLKRRRAEMLVHLRETRPACARKLSGPIASMVERPMAESIE